jgi:DNA-binding response OmpR family regulator
MNKVLIVDANDPIVALLRSAGCQAMIIIIRGANEELPEILAAERFIGPFRIDASKAMVWRCRESLDLSPKEYMLFLVLAKADGALISKRSLLQTVWGASNLRTRTLETHIKQLRHKIFVTGDPPFIRTRFKQGYYFDVSAAVEFCGRCPFQQDCGRGQ